MNATLAQQNVNEHFNKVNKHAIKLTNMVKANEDIKRKFIENALYERDYNLNFGDEVNNYIVKTYLAPLFISDLQSSINRGSKDGVVRIILETDGYFYRPLVSFFSLPKQHFWNSKKYHYHFKKGVYKALHPYICDFAKTNGFNYVHYQNYGHIISW